MNNILNNKAAAPGVLNRIIPKLTLLGMLFALAACSNIDDGLPRETGGRAIAFSGDLQTTRATVTTNESLRKIGVFGYSHQGAFPAAPPYSITPDYFLNKAVTYNAGNNIWTYDGVTKYWPEGKNVSFFAYAPYIDVENTFTLSPSTPTQPLTPSIIYTVPDDITRQVDLVWSNALDQTSETNNGQVAFTMKHALTKVNFAVKLHDNDAGHPFLLTIHKLTLRNLIGGGVLSLSNGEWNFNYPSTNAGLTTYGFTPGTGLANVTLDALDPDLPVDPTPLFSGDECLMLIPQTLKDLPNGLSTPEVEISYSYTNSYTGETFPDEKAILKLETPGLDKWNAGDGIDYRITISLLNGVGIEFVIDGLFHTPWVKDNGNFAGDVN